MVHSLRRERLSVTMSLAGASDCGIDTCEPDCFRCCCLCYRPLYVKVRHGPNIMQCQLLVGPQQEMLAKMTSEMRTAAAHSAAEDHNAVRIPRQEEQHFISSFAAPSGLNPQASELFGMVVLSENDQGLAAGQYAVFYQDGLCLGSAQMLGTAH